MADETYSTIKNLLAGNTPQEIHQGLEMVKKEIARVGSSDARPLFEMVSTLFYIDPFDRPDLVPVLDEAVTLIVGFGEWVIPVLVENLDSGDVKAQLAIGQALGHLGADAIQPLIEQYNATKDAVRCTFILYGLGKIKSPKIIQAVPITLEAASDPDLELRDTAIRALGKFAESIPTGSIPPSMHKNILDQLRTSLADPSAGIRAKSIRSLGKLAKYGHLSPTEKEEVKAACHRLLGKDEAYEWDRAFIVRREAEETLRNVS